MYLDLCKYGHIRICVCSFGCWGPQAQRPLFIAPRPVKLLRRRSAEAARGRKGLGMSPWLVGIRPPFIVDFSMKNDFFP